MVQIKEVRQDSDKIAAAVIERLKRSGITVVAWDNGEWTVERLLGDINRVLSVWYNAHQAYGAAIDYLIQTEGIK